MPDPFFRFKTSVPSGRLSYLDLVNLCDSFPYPGQPAYHIVTGQAVKLRIAGYNRVTFGMMPRSVAEKIHRMDPTSWRLDWTSNGTITLTAGPDEPTRSTAIAKTLTLAREANVFEILEGWRNELYPVYGPDGELVLKYERAACGLFGFITYGVVSTNCHIPPVLVANVAEHMTAYCRVPQPGRDSYTENAQSDFQVWVPRRSPTKPTFPNMLDQSVAGGIAAGESARTTLVRECMEEASIPEHIAQKASMAGVVTYFYVSGQSSGGERGLLQPECEYVYDLDLTEHPELVLKPNDGEVQGFSLMSIDEVNDALANGEFKPNCALILIDFLIRHGITTIENERNYVEIVSRLHRRLDFPVGRSLQDEH
jgi:isopentenyldiphosphate isomerase